MRLHIDRGGSAWRRVLMIAVALGVLLAVYWPVQAAMELMYFRAESTDSSVLLSWATAREIDVEGYLILCKLASEPESAYHFIGQRAAIGGPDQSAEYSFAVTEGVYYGEQYCFRLEEVTTNDEPGEKRDICGYGPGVTPTPDVGAVPGALPGASQTPIVVAPVPGQSPAPTLITPGPTPTWTPIGQSPIEGGAPPISPLATPTQPVSPIGGVTPTMLADAASQSAGVSPTPTFTPSPTVSPTATQLISPQVTPTATTTALANAGAGAVPTPEPASLLVDEGGAAVGAGSGAPTPTSPYIVVTATPTAAAIAVAPTLTPFPTATSVPNLGLLSVVSPTAQNLMVMMLCLIFLSATGLGTLGLVATVLYFRSQAQRRTDGYTYSDRSYRDRRRF